MGGSYQALGISSTDHQAGPLTMRHIRAATKEDASGITALYRELMQDPAISVLPEQVQSVADDNNTSLLVCDDGEGIVATALVCLCRDVMYNNQPFTIVENLVVAENYKREGIGKSLMDYIETFSLQQHCSKIMLLTNSENRSARDFYTAMGYDPDEKIGFVKHRKYFQA